MNLRRLVAMAVVVVAASRPAAAVDDLEAWHSAAGSYLRDGKWRFGISAEARLNDDATFLLYARLGHTAGYRLGDRWSFGANLSAIRARARSGPHLDTLRVELIATPRWKLSPTATFDLRNRIDYLIPEGSIDEELLLRIRPRVVFTSASGKRSFWIANETFFSESAERVVQNRFHPIGLQLPAGQRLRLDLYTMILSTRVAGDWHHDLVLGTHWLF